MGDLGDRWSDVAAAASGAHEAARAYQQLRDDPARSEDERALARDTYKAATKRLCDTLREAKVQEHDGLWSEALEAVQQAQAAAHNFLAYKHYHGHSKSERTEAKRTYAHAKSRLRSLMVELEVVPPCEAAAPDDGKTETGLAETGDESEPASSEFQSEELQDTGPPSWAAGSMP